MQAILLCAGRGERLRPLTDVTPKPLIKVNDRPLIDYQLEHLKKAGVTDVVINVAWLADQIMDYVDNGEQYGLTVRYSIEPEEALETGGGIVQAMSLIDDEQFIVCNADIFHNADFSLLTNQVDSLDDDHLAYLLLVENPTHNPDGDFCLDGVKVIPRPSGLPKTRSQVKSFKPHTYTGIGLYKRKFFAGLKNGRFALGPILKEKIAQGYVKGELFTGAWFDAGTKERLLEIEKYISHSDDRSQLIRKTEQIINL